MVKVGDIVVGKASASKVYGVTVEGWRGRVNEVFNSSDFIRVESMSGFNSYLVESKHFTPIETEEYKKFELTEKIVRDLLGCPKGYRVKCGAMSYSPYTITDKEILDCDGDSVEYMEFIYDLDGHEYELEKEPEVEEMTMEEICKALGKNIKIVKGDNE